MATQDPIQRLDRTVAGEEPVNLSFKTENVAVVHQGLIGVAKWAPLLVCLLAHLIKAPAKLAQRKP